MRLQTKKIIQREDPQIVLHALEVTLRQISLDVVLDGHEIILHGLGPSPRTINHRDTAILRVDTEENQTVINADVTFQPSCLLGESLQIEAVNYKLDRVFDQMSTEITLERQRKAPPPINTSSLRPRKRQEQTFSSLQSVEATRGSSSIVLNAPHALLSVQENVHTSSKDTAADCLPTIRQPQPFAFPPTRWRAFSVAAVVCITLLSSSYLVLRIRIHGRTSGDPSYPTQPTMRARSTPYLMERSPVDVKDPLEWLGNWVAAMRTRDPIAQASFYADRVDLYLGEKNVSKARIVARKKTAIEHRVALWTIKLEGLVLVHESATSISVNLIKHSIAQGQSAKISEKFVRCHLHLRRMSGAWRIISEEDSL